MAHQFPSFRYPSDVDKHILARQTGLSRSQVSNWFINARVRLWKPMVEDMYLDDMKEQNSQSSNATTDEQQDNANPNPNPNPGLDQKPAPVQLLNDSDSLSSIINSSHRSDPKNTTDARASQHYHNHEQHQVPRAEKFGVANLDFPYGSCGSQNLGGGVSLTLGLQQHSGGGMSLSFSPASQHSLLFSREHMDDDGQQVQFTILDGEAQTLPYRNMMGAQLLHDLAG